MQTQQADDTCVWKIFRRFALACVLSVCYVLSVGPVSWLCWNGYGVPVIAVEVVYSPIWWVKDSSTPGTRIVDGYLSYWILWPRIDYEDVPPER